MTEAPAICVYCGSSDNVAPAFPEAAYGLGLAMALAGVTLIFGGGAIGLMGKVADGVLAGGGTAIGVIPPASRGTQPRPSRPDRVASRRLDA